MNRVDFDKMLTVTHVSRTRGSTWVRIRYLGTAKMLERGFSIDTARFTHAYHATRKRTHALAAKDCVDNITHNGMYDLVQIERFPFSRQ